MMTIIYGGTFNPPTIAHFEIAKYLMNKFPNSKLVFLPTPLFMPKVQRIIYSSIQDA